MWNTCHQAKGKAKQLQGSIGQSYLDVLRCLYVLGVVADF